MAEYRVEYVTLSGGKSVPASALVCPQCDKLDLATDIDTTAHPWKCVCSKGHEFTVNALEN